MRISADTYIERLEQLGFIFAVAMDKSRKPHGVYTGFPDDAQAEMTGALALEVRERGFTAKELAAAIMARLKAN